MADNMNGTVSDEIKQELLLLKKEDLTVSYIMNKFGSTTTKDKDGKFIVAPPHFIQNQKMRLSANEYINQKDIVTNVGLFLFNKLLIENQISNIIPDGYWNIPLDKKSFGKLFDIISNALLNAKTDIPTVVAFLKDYEFYGLKLVTTFSPAYTLDMIMPERDIDEEKEKYVKENPNMTMQDMGKFEDKLVAESKEKLKDNPGMVLYNSGARGDFSNDHKNMVIGVGPVMNPVNNKYSYMKSNYMDGIQKDDLVSAGNIVVTSEYPKAVGTQKGGYLTKQFYAVFQGITVDTNGSDCGTKKGIHVLLNNFNIEDFYDQYVINNDGSLTQLTSDNAKQYINTYVTIRSPMYCLNDVICNKCAGERYTKLDMPNAGISTARVSNRFLNLSLKQRHNMKLKLDSVDINSMLIMDKK